MLDHWLITVNLMMETLVSLGAHCLLLLLDPAMANLPCFMVWSGCHLRSAFCLLNVAVCLVKIKIYLVPNFKVMLMISPVNFCFQLQVLLEVTMTKWHVLNISDIGIFITCSGNYFQWKKNFRCWKKYGNTICFHKLRNSPHPFSWLFDWSSIVFREA